VLTKFQQGPKASGRLAARGRGWGSLSAGSVLAAGLVLLPAVGAQEAGSGQGPAQAPVAAPAPTAAAGPASSATPGEAAALEPRPLAIVPLDSKIAGAAAEVTGALKVYNGRAFITSSGAVTAGPATTQVTLPYRGTLKVCAATTVKLAADANAPAGVVPGLMMAMDHGALEASFATGRDSDILLTPDFRILIGGPGAADVKVRLGPNGDTCVDNAGVSAPYVLVTSVFEGGDYHVQAGQRVMFQHGSLHAVVDEEKEPCGCPPEVKGPNEFPLAASEGLAVPALPVTSAASVGHVAETTGTLAYNAEEHAPTPVAATPVDAGESAAPVRTPTIVPVAPVAKKPGFFVRVGRFFKKIFGAE